jgi:hypothetical protein
MATVVDQQVELEEFHQFIGRHLKNGGTGLTVDRSVAEFRAYQEELERCREAIRPALEASLRGESTPLNMQDIIDRVTARLRKEGVPD